MSVVENVNGLTRAAGNSFLQAVDSISSIDDDNIRCSLCLLCRPAILAIGIEWLELDCCVAQQLFTNKIKPFLIML